MEYYLAGIRAYQLQDCRSAIKWLEEALAKDPSLESYDPQIKFKIGYCAYMIGDFDRARTYLSLYPDNALARSILKSIGKVEQENEWMKWLMTPEKEPIPVATETQVATPQKAGKSAHVSFYMLVLGVFITVFATLMILEWRGGFVTSLVMKLMGPGVVVVEESKEVAEEIEEEKKEKVEEKEIELDLDELLNSTIDTVDKLIYGEEGFVKGEVVEEEVEEPEEEAEEVAEEVGEEEKEGAEEKEELMKEISQAVKEETLTEDDESEVEKKADELLKELEEMEDVTLAEDAAKTLDDIVEELEAKEKYEPDDARKFLLLVERYVEEKKEEAQI